MEYRISGDGGSALLWPPAISDPTAPLRFTLPSPPEKGRCVEEEHSASLRQRRRNSELMVPTAALTSQPAGWIRSWLTDLESRGCIATGFSSQLARHIVESAVLPVSSGLDEIYGPAEEGIDLLPGMYLEVTSPIRAEGVPDISSSVKDGNQITIANASVRGYEIDRYAVDQRPNAPGVVLRVESSEDFLPSGSLRRGFPAVLHLAPAMTLHHFRLVHKADRTLFVGYLIASQTEIPRFPNGGDGLPACDGLVRLCRLDLPRDVAVNTVIRATVNGMESYTPWASTVWDAVKAKGVRQPDNVTDKLTVCRPYGRKLIPVRAASRTAQLLDMRLIGGESISWNGGMECAAAAR